MSRNWINLPTSPNFFLWTISHLLFLLLVAKLPPPPYQWHFSSPLLSHLLSYWSMLDSSPLFPVHGPLSYSLYFRYISFSQHNLFEILNLSSLLKIVKESPFLPLERQTVLFNRKASVLASACYPVKLIQAPTAWISSSHSISIVPLLSKTQTGRKRHVSEREERMTR